MRQLSLHQLPSITGGLASLTSEGVLVTDSSSMVLNGFAFCATGEFTNIISGEVLFDFANNAGPFIFEDSAIDAKPQGNGYLFTITSC